MNAYELADKLEWHWDNDCRSPAVSKSADMLRQQADRIAELEKEAEECWCQGHSYEYLRAKNRLPQTKPLSDEEIIKIFNQIWVDGGNTNGVMHRFARAIEAKVRGEK